MSKFIVTALAVIMLAVAAPASASTHNCGSFKFGTDGGQPGPSGILATNVDCWTARAIVLLGPPKGKGWHQRAGQGLTFYYTRGDQKIRFYGE
jgi:hypothetical protein